MEEQTPAQLGYRWPAEWEPHAGTWLSWPHNLETWPGNFAPIPGVFSQFVREVAEREPVHILAHGEALKNAWEHVGEVCNVHLYDVQTNDAWIRDHGPMFLSGGKNRPPALVDWEYNAWGGKYPPFDADNLVPRQVAERLNYRRFHPGLVLEGGAVDTDGEGTVLTTTTCLLNPNRNGERTQAEMEELLVQYCCARKVLWLSGGDMEGDDTDGHVDQLARFVAPGKVVVAVASNKSDKNHAATVANLRALHDMTDAAGRTLEVIPLELPSAKYYDERRLPASYANFYIANGVVVVPTFQDPQDEPALKQLQECFPDRDVVGIDALEFVWGLGSFHCASQQQPRADLPGMDEL